MSFATKGNGSSPGCQYFGNCTVFTRNSVFLLEAFLDEAERKYLFECDSEEQCVEWVDAIIKAR